MLVWLLLSVSNTNGYTVSKVPGFLNVSGHIPSLSLSCAVGWQPFQRGWASDVDVSAVSHLCTMHSLSVHPSSSILCSSCSIQSQIPSRWKGTRQVRLITSLKNVTLKLIESLALNSADRISFFYCKFSALQVEHLKIIYKYIWYWSHGLRNCSSKDVCFIFIMWYHIQNSTGMFLKLSVAANSEK